MAEKNTTEYDVIIIGGGPAGLSAGIIAAYKGLRTAVFEGGTWGGLLSTIYPYKHVFNYPGIPKILASHLVAEWVKQAADLGVYLMHERVTEITSEKQVSTEDGTYSAKVIIIATGMRPNTLGIPGEVEFSRKNRGVFPYVTEPEFFHDKRVLVIGGGDTALDAVVDAHSVTDKIWLAHRKDKFRAAESIVNRIVKEEMAEIRYNTEIREIRGETEVTHATLEDNKTGKKWDLEVDRVVIAVGLIPNTEVFSNLGLKMNNRFIATDGEMRTNIEGLFAAGDIVSVYQLATVAAAQGALAAHNAYKHIRKPYWSE
ncbi:MAG: NAD(P)/FAD-dependent oxidoreductase [Candidatus Thorarchaeota archaeon]|nr:NAD(P)/FAD-dependent oxidoreductase [Candidatus Thorarchaeota archaeon]